MLHKEILTNGQIALLPMVKSFSDDFYLVGGTAIALHLGHRRSIDFDLFTQAGFKAMTIKRRIERYAKAEKCALRFLRSEEGELTFLMGGVKFTFFQYPFEIPANERFERVIRMPDLLTLAAMKAYALGQRAKWKDYVDLYFIIKKYHGIQAIAGKAKEIFQGEFNERIIREQLGYFDDVSYAEEVEYMPGHEIDDETVKKELEQYSLS